MASDLSIPCVRDGKPSSPHEGGEHHIQTKGMGGLGPKAPVSAHKRVPLCRGCHNDIHAGDFWLEVSDDDIVQGWEGDSETAMVVFERGLTVDDTAEDSRRWSDEKLSERWGAGEELALDGFGIQCRAAFEFYRRYHSQEKWYERVAQIISDNNGHFTHWREVYRRVKLYTMYGNDWATYRRLGKTVALAVAESDDSEKALEIAETARDEGGHTSTEIIREIRHQEPPEPKRCKSCGAVL